ncbi:MAG: TetR/AcrR family transcriptional regulator [Deltaproteobacteria bacterium]|nr:TetR/AcrR family transcriptional regulator [Deltaproteobacteria bacterium]
MKEGLEDILKKSCQLMAEKGYYGTSVRDLAETTGRSLAGLYHYFENKEELLYLVNHQGFSTLIESAELIAARSCCAEEKIYRFICNHIHYFVSHRDEMHVMMLGTQELDSVRGRRIKMLKSKYAGIGVRLVEELLQRANNHSSQDLQRRTYLLFGMMNWIFGWYSAQKHGSEQELIDDIFHIFLGGALGSEGSLDALTKQTIYEEVRNGLRRDH